MLFVIATFIRHSLGITDIKKVADPTVSWSNINFGSPIIKIFFATNIDFNTSVQNFWLKVTVPFFTNSLSAQWAVDNCSPSLDFKNAVEERVSATTQFTEFYVQFSGAVFQKMTTYVLRIIPNPYIDFLGFSDPFKIAFISKNVDNHLVYAYNNALFHFLGTSAPKNDLILKPLFRSNDCLVKSRFCAQNLKIKFTTTESVYRIVIELKGSYLFNDFDQTSCYFMKEGSIDSERIPKNFYSCNLSDNFGDLNRYLVFESSIVLKPGNYFVRFTTKTPEFIGSHSFRVFIMDKYSSTVISYAQIDSQFTVKPFNWSTDYPKLRFSFGFNAADSTLPYYLGLYSTSTTYNQVLNTLTFYIKAEELPPLGENEYLTVRVYLGLPNPIFPLGQVRENFDSLENVEKQYSRTDDHLDIDKVIIYTEKVYTISYKIGFLNSGDLNSSSENGFGVVQILKNDKVVVSGKAAYKIGFAKVLDNKNIFIPESVDTTAQGYHRGYSAFRSALPTQLLNTPANYYLKPDRHGLRIGDSQEFFVQSSAGAIQLYTPSITIASDHTSTRSFLQIVTHPSVRSQSTSFPDSDAQTNCKFYSSTFAKWSNQFTLTEAQTALDPSLTTVITTPPTSYNPIYGCSYSKVDYDLDQKVSYSRFRMRFKDLDCRDQNALPIKVTGVKLAFPYSNTQLGTVAQRKGNLFVFNNIDVVDPKDNSDYDNDFYILDAFFHVYFYSNIFQTDQLVSSVPNIVMMDNMYVLANPANSFISAADLHMFLQNAYYTVSAGVRTMPDLTQFPPMMSIYGKFTSMSQETEKIRIFFDLMEPLPVDSNSAKVDCKSQGLKVKSCKLESGISAVQEITYLASTLASNKLLYLNSKFSSSLMIEIDPDSVVAANSLFMLTFPIQVMSSANTEKFLLTSSDTMSAFPSFIFYDKLDQIIQRVDYGNIGTFLNLYSYHTNYLLGSLNMLTNAQIATIFDATTGNEPAKYTNFVYNSAQVGGLGSLSYIVKGTGFKSMSSGLSDFTSATFCSKSNFAINPTFSVVGPTASTYYSKCSYHIYLGKHCFFCPELQTTDTSFTVTNMTFPSTNGLLWPSGSISVISNYVPIMAMDHSIENNPLMPSKLTLINSEMTIPFAGLSFMVEIQLRLTNSLAANSFIIFRRTAGDFRLALKGDNSKPFCKIIQQDVTAKCFFQLIAQIVKVQVYSSIQKSTPVKIQLFGLSTEGAASAVDLEMEAFTAIDGTLSTNSMIDSSLPDLLKIIYDSQTTTGSISIANVTMAPNLNNVMTDLSFNITIKDRKLYPNDAIYIDLGSEGLHNQVSILMLEATTKAIITQVSSIEVVSSKELLIKDIDNFNDQSFMLKIWSFKMTSDATSAINSQYTFNNGFAAFKSPSADYPEIISAPSSTGYVTIRYSGAGFKSGIVFNIKPKFTVKESDVIFLRFDTIYSPNLSNFPLYAFENNFGSNKLNIWYESPFVLGINGFKNEFDANRYFNFWIYGLQLFDFETSVYVMIASEEGIQQCKETIKITINSAIQSQYVSEVVIRKLLFSPRNLRMTGRIGFRLSIPQFLSQSQSMIIHLDHLYQEILKPISPKCYLYYIQKSKFINYAEVLTMDPNSATNSTQNFTTDLSLVDDIIVRTYNLTSCKILGNNLEIVLAEDVGTELLLVVDGVPTPDTKSCRFIQPSLSVTNARNTKVLMSSSPITSNAQRTTFENYKTLSSINYKNYKSSFVEIVRGFYEVVTAVVDFSPSNSYTFKKEMSFVLINNEDGKFVSQTYNPRTGEKSQAEIGKTSVDLVIGAEKQTNIYVYPLIIAKQELAPIMYTEMPVLNAKVISKRLSLIHTNQQIRVNRGGKSLPIIIRCPKYPINEQFFSLKITGIGASNLKITDEIDEFSFSFSNTVFMLTVMSTGNDSFGEAALEITPVDLTLFYLTRISLILVYEQPKDDNFAVSVGLIQDTSVQVQFTTQNQVYVCFFVAPVSTTLNFSQSYIENMVKIGAYSRNGINFRVDTIFEVSTQYGILIDELTPNSEYRLQGFYTIGSQNLKGNFTTTFITRTKI